MTDLDDALCAEPDPHEAHDYPLDGPDWVGGPVWHCPGRVPLPAVPETDDPALPGISASKFREDLRTVLLTIGLPLWMFGVVMHMWGFWLLLFMSVMAAVSVSASAAQRARRLNAERRQGELP